MLGLALLPGGVLFLISVLTLLFQPLEKSQRPTHSMYLIEKRIQTAFQSDRRVEEQKGQSFVLFYFAFKMFMCIYFFELAVHIHGSKLK